jgi:transposase InsO family protein
MFGLPDRIFTDNGGQYINKHIQQVCAKLGIKKMNNLPRNEPSVRLT